MRHEKTIYILLFTFLIYSCDDKVVEDKNDNINIDPIVEKIDIITHKQLVEAKVKYLGDGMCENFEEYEKASEKTFTKKETQDTLLTIESYFTRSGCTGYEGNISINSDTLFLKLESNTNMSCTELEYYKVVYKIRKTKREKYIIVKE